MIKEYRIMFRADEILLERIKKLGSKLGLGRGEVLRFCVNKMFEKYLNTEEEILLVDNEKWNATLGAYLEGFIKQVGQVKELAEVLTKKVKKTGNVQSTDVIDVTEADLAKWIDLAIKDDRNFDPSDPNPEAEKAKKAILTTIQRLKGRVI